MMKVDGQQLLRQRIQHLIDDAPIVQVDHDLSDSWMQQIRLALLGRGANARNYTYRLNDVSWGAHADVTDATDAHTQVHRAVQLLVEMRTAIDRGRFTDYGEISGPYSAWTHVSGGPETRRAA